MGQAGSLLGTSFPNSLAQTQKQLLLVGARHPKPLADADKRGRDASCGSGYTSHFEHRDFALSRKKFATWALEMRFFLSLVFLPQAPCPSPIQPPPCGNALTPKSNHVTLWLSVLPGLSQSLQGGRYA